MTMLTDKKERLQQIMEELKIISEADTFDDAQPSAPASDDDDDDDEDETFYDILEIDKSATQQEIRAAWLDLAKKYHPDGYEHLAKDLRDQAEERFKKIKEAYDTLSDPQKRKDYDLTIS